MTGYNATVYVTTHGRMGTGMKVSVENANGEKRVDEFPAMVWGTLSRLPAYGPVPFVIGTPFVIVGDIAMFPKVGCYTRAQMKDYFGIPLAKGSKVTLEIE